MNRLRAHYPSWLAYGAVAALCALVGVWLLQARPSGADPSKQPPPATVGKILQEELVNEIVLTPQAVKSIALQTVAVERKAVPRTRVYGGEVTVPAGQTILVAAPLSGVLQAPATEPTPAPGASVSKGREVFRLQPLLTPEGRANLAIAGIDAEGQVKNAHTKVSAALVALNRAKLLLKDGAGSDRAVEEAKAQYDLADKELETVKARRELLDRVVGEINKGTTAPLSIVAPQDGMLRNLSAVAGQNVPAGAALFEIATVATVWVRVAVYVGDQAEIERAQPAAIGPLTLRPGDPTQPAAPIDAPPTANALAGTVDLYYTLDNRKAQYGPGQRVGVTLPLKVPMDSLVVPWSAIVHDIYGGTWVYEQTAERTFVRRRVRVRWVAGTMAVLAEGPTVGAHVVTAGAEELFGSEVGFTK